MTDVAAAQAAVAELLLDDGALESWRADRQAFASTRLAPAAAAMVAGLDARGFGATAAVVRAKGARERHRAPAPVRTPTGGIHSSRPSDRAASGERARDAGVLVGCGYRPPLLRHLWRSLSAVEVWEHTVDNYLDDERGVAALGRFAGVGPVVLHSVDLSVGSPAARARPERIRSLRAVVEAAGVDELSDHMAFSRVDDRSLHDFVPLWRVEEQLELVVANVDWLQHELGVRLGLENVSALFDPGGEIGWAEFANEVVARTGCSLLLDISNLLLDEANGLREAAAELGALDLHAVTGVHLAGGVHAGGIFWDAHEAAVPAADLEWLERLLPCMPNCRTVIVERDGRLDDGDELLADLHAVRGVRDALVAESA